MLNGINLIDISNVNGTVDWRKVYKAGIRGVWLKATEGVTYDDPRYTEDAVKARAAGLRVGTYHFARPDNNPADREAAHFCAVIGTPRRRDLRPVLDLEKECNLTPAKLEAWAHTFSQHVSATIGVLPLFYSYPAYIRAMDAQTPIGAGLWLASYGVNDGRNHSAVAPAPWKHWAAHQYTSKGQVAGVNGDVDRSYAPAVRPLLAHPILGLI
jgi:lysozyme